MDKIEMQRISKMKVTKNEKIIRTDNILTNCCRKHKRAAISDPIFVWKIFIFFQNNLYFQK